MNGRRKGTFEERLYQSAKGFKTGIASAAWRGSYTLYKLIINSKRKLAWKQIRYTHEL
jgi:hypothetical protein